VARRSFSLDEVPKNDDPLRDFFVGWMDSIPPASKRRLRSSLNAAIDERPIQQFLTTNPVFLVRHLSGGHGRWVIPQKKLGAEFVPDFVVGHKDSAGYHWTLVELESPRAPMFTRAGTPAKQLNHALKQIRDWHSWLESNRDYAKRPRLENGLGLTNISTNPRALILISRRSLLRPEDTERRRQLQRAQPRLSIHTYDWLLTLD
jgi:Shedu protein SduA, C-terminal